MIPLTRLSAMALLLASGWAGVCSAQTRPFQPSGERRKETAKPAASAPMGIRDGLGFRLFTGLCATAGSGNAICSPWSIREALTIASLGASGATAEQFQRFLGPDETHAKPVAAAAPSNLEDAYPPEGRRNAGSERPKAAAAPSNLEDAYQPAPGQAEAKKIAIANSVWVQKELKIEPDFAKAVAERGAAVEQVDFASEAAIPKINEWVKAATNSKISEIVSKDSIDERTRLTIVNAVYFKAAWEKPFTESKTINNPFHVTRAQTVPAKMMRQQDHFRYFEDQKAQAVELPYMGRAYSMWFVLPAEGDEGASAPLLESDVARWTSSATEQAVQVEIPRFKLGLRTSLNSLLTQLGLDLPFSNRADFSKIAKGEPLALSDVLHNAAIEVNETGTEASAATAAVVTARGGFRIPIFRANRPFYFLLVDNATRGVVFAGRLANPSEMQ